MTTPQEIISYLLPFVATAGSYSAQIQREVGMHDAKPGETIFHSALSDADVTIQAYIEVALLAKFPHVSFFSEEQEQSLNRKYFAADYELEVLLDPIDGTRSYVDSREQYQVIVTIHDRTQIVGAICHMPRRGHCYTAVRGGGAFILTEEEVRRAAQGERHSVAGALGPVLVFNRPDLVEKLSPHVEVVDLLTSYLRTPGKHNMTDLMEGRAAATLHAPCQGIDGGAIALIAAEAGATVSDFHGRPLGNFRECSKRTVPNALVSSSREMHERILSALNP